jgi:predicted nucleic acid-binding protein
MIHPRVAERLGPIIESGEASTCAIIDLEVLFSARKYEDYLEAKRRRLLAYHRIALNEAIFERALEAQEALAAIGHHRLPISDLIISAAAELASLTVLHYDSDFDTIARVTGQPTEWVVKRGTVP